MSAIRVGIENSLNEEQITTYADPTYDSKQMFEIQRGFINGLSMEQVLSYADPSIPWDEMEEMRTKMEKDKTKSAMERD